MSRKRRLLWLASLYLALLLGSHLVREVWPANGDLPPGMEAVELPEMGPGAKAEDTIRLAYRDLPADKPDAPVVLLLHGSPFPAGESFDDMLPYLQGRYRLIIPDLPGFGHSTRELPHYASATHALYLSALLDRLNVDDVHVVGYSMSGAVALYLERLEPERTDSITLLSAIGVLEYELFGNETLNHAVHTAQLGAIWFLIEAVPHFGLLDRQPLNLAYARNFYDTDQRPLRDILRTYDEPLLIIHGQHDALIPVQAAEEHRRLAPQAELTLLDGGHIILWDFAQPVAERVQTFVQRVEAGRGLTRAQTSPALQEAAQAPFVRDPSWRYMGMALAVIVLLLALTTLITEDLACIGAGIIAANGLIPLSTAIIACFCGIFVGDLMLYTAGRFLGRSALRRRPFRWIVSEMAVAEAELWFHRRGPIIILVTRFLPGTRAATYFTAGILRAHFGRFLLFFGVAAALWTPALVTLASLLGNRLLVAYESYAGYALPVFALLALALYALIDLGIPLLTWRGRRLLLSRWKRMRHWEFWPLWRVNAPVFLYVLWLGFIRYRRPTLFTLCNPGILHGGYIGESKSDILGGLAGAGEAVGRWEVLPPGLPQERLRAVESFLARRGLRWPVVLKPDEGQRGLAVQVAHDPAQALQYLEKVPVALIVQEYLPGEEFGVFYARMPDEPTGRVLSVTIKKLIHVSGDGQHTLEELILLDDRAVALAPTFLTRFRTRLEEIPAPGERVPLVQVGTHARGALFLDGRHLITPELEAAVHAIARTFEGFYFGRFDIRAPSAEHLRRGEGLRVIELNGLTAEQTHIYDPQHTLWNAWKTLFGQWKLAFEIGRQNLARGHQPSGKIDFLRHWYRAHRRLGQVRTPESLAAQTAAAPAPLSAEAGAL